METFVIPVLFRDPCLGLYLAIFVYRLAEDLVELGVFPFTEVVEDAGFIFEDVIEVVFEGRKDFGLFEYFFNWYPFRFALFC